MNPSDIKIGIKIQIAIAANVILAILLGEFIVTQWLNLSGTEGIITNLVINGTIAFAYGYFVSRAITRPLKEVTKALHVLAQGDGDLTQRLVPQSKDEVGQLSRDFNTFLDKLHNIISNVAASTHRLAETAKNMQQITSESKDQIEHQQTETEQAATAMNQMAETVKDISRNAASAESSAQEADVRAKEGSNISNQAMNGMKTLVNEVETAADAIQELGKEVDDISQILNVIKDITEQTNLLALNAAIEAARAGEAGRGFAVVADEVRSLASRTQDSAAEIGKVINKLQSGSQTAVNTMEAARNQGQEGYNQVKRTHESLSDIVTSVTSISQMNTQIAAAAEQQSATTDEVNRNISTINSSTVATGEGTSRTVQTSYDLANLATELESLMGQFKLEASA